MKIAEKRKAGEILGRATISEKIIALAEDIVNSGSYKNAVIKGGMISILIESCGYDPYWQEKALIGRHRQEELFEKMLA